MSIFMTPSRSEHAFLWMVKIAGGYFPEAIAFSTLPSRSGVPLSFRYSGYYRHTLVVYDVNLGIYPYQSQLLPQVLDAQELQG